MKEARLDGYCSPHCEEMAEIESIKSALEAQVKVKDEIQRQNAIEIGNHEAAYADLIIRLKEVVVKMEEKKQLAHERDIRASELWKGFAAGENSAIMECLHILRSAFPELDTEAEWREYGKPIKDEMISDDELEEK